jgi:polysaccharide export outer membrane protein
VGEVDAKGKTVADLNKLMTQRLTKYISDPVVTVSVQEIKGNKVYVIGQVNKPGEFVMNPTVDVMQALSMAGGTTPFASLGDIVVLRRNDGGKQSIPFRYNDVVKGRRTDQNIDLQAGDVVVVP